MIFFKIYNMIVHYQNLINILKLFKVTKWEDFSSVLTPLLNYLGPYVAVRHEVAVKIVRLINIFFTEEDVKQLPNYDSRNVFGIENFFFDLY